MFKRFGLTQAIIVFFVAVVAISIVAFGMSNKVAHSNMPAVPHTGEPIEETEDDAEEAAKEVAEEEDSNN